jgi:hypothetical protein
LEEWVNCTDYRYRYAGFANPCNAQQPKTAYSR